MSLREGNATCDSILLIAFGCMNIQEEMHRGENPRWKIYTRINHMEHSKDAIRIKWICRSNNGFLHKQLENQNSLGELLWRARRGHMGNKLDEPWSADFVVEHVSAKADCNGFEGSSWTTQREWSVQCSWRDARPVSEILFFWSNLEIWKRILRRCSWKISEDLVLAARREEIEWMRCDDALTAGPPGKGNCCGTNCGANKLWIKRHVSSLPSLFHTLKPHFTIWSRTYWSRAWRSDLGHVEAALHDGLHTTV